MRFSAPVFVLALLEAILWNSPNLCLDQQQNLDQFLVSHIELIKFCGPQTLAADAVVQGIAGNASSPLSEVVSSPSAVSALNRLRELEVHLKAEKEKEIAGVVVATAGLEQHAVPRSMHAQQHLVLAPGSRSPMESADAAEEGKPAADATSGGNIPTTNPEIMAALSAVICAVAWASSPACPAPQERRNKRPAQQQAPQEQSSPALSATPEQRCCVSPSPVMGALAAPVRAAAAAAAAAPAAEVVESSPSAASLFDEDESPLSVFFSGDESAVESDASVSPCVSPSPAHFDSAAEPLPKRRRVTPRTDKTLDRVPCSLPAELREAFESERREYARDAGAEACEQQSQAEHEAREAEQRIAWLNERVRAEERKLKTLTMDAERYKLPLDGHFASIPEDLMFG
eukprot:m51a1_g5123 hypothetical protein (401) ;mRNA; r:382854-384610